MFYLCYLCLFAYSGVQHILCCVFVLFFFILCTLCCKFLWIFLFLIAPLVFSNVYFIIRKCYLRRYKYLNEENNLFVYF